jgi:hypothetical protein
VAAAGPAYPLDQALAGGWSFVGFSADEEALAAGAVTPLFTFWQGPPGATPGAAQDGWHSIDVGLWLQIQRASNLLPSGLQLALPGAEMSAPIPIDRRRLYLQAASVRSLNGAAARAGVVWQGSPPPAEDGVTETGVLGTQYIALNSSHAAWTPVAGLLTAPASAQTAQVLLAGEEAVAEARGLLLLPVTPPIPLNGQ